MKKLFFFCFIFCAFQALAIKPKCKYVKISTKKGDCIVRLYNETPMHRDNFVRLVQTGFYNDLLFHRVIKGFMIQGGDPSSKNAKPDAMLGEGDVGYKLYAEIRDSLFHKKGVLAAARDNNPEKASSGCQFYLVQGNVFSDEQLNQIELRRSNQKIPEWQRQVYKTIGGTPFLDQNYTVFGEIVKNIQLVDAVAAVPVLASNRPKEDVKMNLVMLTDKEAEILEKELINKELNQKK
ncbi:MAG: peptidylprolyl isomerase [Sphingobacteriaceae bacterium]|nr:peptidylprolyl isomerase [Sphingobacteriaceae bacterium]